MICIEKMIIFKNEIEIQFVGKFPGFLLLFAETKNEKFNVNRFRSDQEYTQKKI